VVIPPRDLGIGALVDIVPVDGEKLMATQGRQGDAVVKDNDLIVVQRLVGTVAVLGAVAQSGEVVYVPNEGVKNVLQRVGGATEDADLDHLTVLRVNGTALPEQKAGKLKPGDIVIVPSKYLMKVQRAPTPFFDLLWNGLMQAFAITKIF
jgi:protein involved in polysaccharide export with SLBB domain